MNFSPRAVNFAAWDLTNGPEGALVRGAMLAAPQARADAAGAGAGAAFAVALVRSDLLWGPSQSQSQSQSVSQSVNCDGGRAVCCINAKLPAADPGLGQLQPVACQILSQGSSNPPHTSTRNAHRTPPPASRASCSTRCRQPPSCGACPQAPRSHRPSARCCASAATRRLTRSRSRRRSASCSSRGGGRSGRWTPAARGACMR